MSDVTMPAIDPELLRRYGGEANGENLEQFHRLSR